MANDDKRNLFKPIVGERARLPESGPLGQLKAKPFMGAVTLKDFSSVKALRYRSQTHLSPQGGVTAGDVTKVKAKGTAPSVSGMKIKNK